MDTQGTNDPHRNEQDEGETFPGLADSERDLNMRALAGLGLIILIVAVAIFVLTGVVLNYLGAPTERQAGGLNPPVSVPVQRPPAEIQEFPEPQLQVNEPAYLDAVRAAEQRTLDSYGWINRRTQTVRVPIDRAMELILEDGRLKVRADATELGISDDDYETADSSSGRIIQDNR